MDAGRLTRHVVLPALAPLAIVGLYFTPVALVGCANRGLMALGVVGLGMVGSMVCMGAGVRARARGGGDYLWWLLSAAILLVPAGLVLGPLG